MAALALAVAFGTLLAIGYREALADPVVREARMALPDWPVGAPPVTFALLSDIHIGGPAMDVARLSRIVAQVNAHHPDLVLVAGDFVIGHDAEDADGLALQLSTPLSKLRAPLGTIAVLGNHDHWTGAAAIMRALKTAGVTTLINRAVRRGPLTIVGIDDAFSGHANARRAFADVTGGVATLTLTHSPDAIPMLADGQAPLLLVGHTHCGQVVLPTGRGLVEHSLTTGKRLYDPRYRCGIIHDPARTVIVTAGVGSGSSPIRLGAPPDWWLIRVGPRSRP